MANLMKQAQARRRPEERRAPKGDVQDVASIAYSLYERRGCVDGHDLEDWLEAERIIRERGRRPA